jgi:hypothetical protein
MNPKLRSLYKDLEILQRSSQFGTRHVKKIKQSTIKPSITQPQVVKKESKGKRFLKGVGKAALYTGGTLASLYALHHAGRYYGTNDKKWENKWNENMKKNKKEEFLAPAQQILKLYNFDPKLPPGDIGFNQYYKREALKLHPDKVNNRKDLTDEEKEKLIYEFKQLGTNKEILNNAGYSFGNTKKVKEVLKKLGGKIWNNKGKIVLATTAAYIGKKAVDSGLHRGRYENFFDKHIKAKLDPEDKKEWEHWKKGLWRVGSWSDKQIIDFTIFLQRTGMGIDILEYIKLNYPKEYILLQKLIPELS